MYLVQVINVFGSSIYYNANWWTGRLDQSRKLLGRGTKVCVCDSGLCVFICVFLKWACEHKSWEMIHHWSYWPMSRWVIVASCMRQWLLFCYCTAATVPHDARVTRGCQTVGEAPVERLWQESGEHFCGITVQYSICTCNACTVSRQDRIRGAVLLIIL